MKSGNVVPFSRATQLSHLFKCVPSFKDAPVLLWGSYSPSIVVVGCFLLCLASDWEAQGRCRWEFISCFLVNIT